MIMRTTAPIQQSLTPEKRGRHGRPILLALDNDTRIKGQKQHFSKVNWLTMDDVLNQMHNVENRS